MKDLGNNESLQFEKKDIAIFIFIFELFLDENDILDVKIGQKMNQKYIKNTIFALKRVKTSFLKQYRKFK